MRRDDAYQSRTVWRSWEDKTSESAVNTGIHNTKCSCSSVNMSCVAANCISKSYQ